MVPLPSLKQLPTGFDGVAGHLKYSQLDDPSAVLGDTVAVMQLDRASAHRARSGR